MKHVTPGNRTPVRPAPTPPPPHPSRRGNPQTTASTPANLFSRSVSPPFPCALARRVCLTVPAPVPCGRATWPRTCVRNRGMCRRTPRGVYVLASLDAFTFRGVSLLEIPWGVGWLVGDCGWFLGGRRHGLCPMCSTVPASTYQHWLEKEKGEKEKDVPSDFGAWAGGCFAVLSGNRT